jgi:hypothetical protein
MRKLTIIAALMLLVLALGATAVLARGGQTETAAAALQAPVVPVAQDDTPTPQDAPVAGPGQMRGHRGANGMGAGIGAGPMWDQGAALDLIAGALNMSVEDLTAALQDGTTIATLAEEAGVSVQSILDSLLAAHQAQLDAAVSAGTITAEQADLMQARMEEMMTQRIQEGFFFGGRGFSGQGEGMNCPYGDGEGATGFGQRGMRGQDQMQGRGFGFGQRGMQGQGTTAPANGTNG